MSKRKKSTSTAWLIMICILAFGVAGACSYYYFSKKGAKVSVTAVSGPKTKPHVTTRPADTQSKVVIYVPSSSAGSVYLVPQTRTITVKDGILNAAIDTLIATNKEKGEVGALIPAGTQLLTPVKVSKGVASVNLSKDFVNNFSGGTDQEALTLNSIAHTLVKNSGGEVKRVQILVEGKTAESLGGHFDLGVPIVADSTMLRPGNKD